MILLHGLARTQRSLAGLRRHLEAAGFPTWSHTYPSRKLSIVELAEDIARRALAEHPRARFMAVTHSMGGVLVRHMTHLLPWRGVVMLAPPNRGSRVALAFRDRPFYRWFYGPAGQDLTRPADWPPPPHPFGVIAGTRAISANPLGWLTRGLGAMPRGVPSDGVVAVEETKLEGMADFATIDTSHTFIMGNPTVREWVVHFLEHGRFKP